ALCYPANNCEDIGKLRRTKKTMEMINVTFDKLSAIAFE
ncbi:hypothetical protein Tco_0589588, partial [Tanacetum coccineum]